MKRYKNTNILNNFLLINLLIYLNHQVSAKSNFDFPDNLIYTGRSCDQIARLQSKNAGGDKKGFIKITGDYVSVDSELAFDCKVDIIVPTGDKSAVKIICQKSTIIETLGDDGGCPLVYEINQGSRKLCGKNEALNETFKTHPINNTVEFRIISRPKSRNKFKGGLPVYDCKIKLESPKSAIDYSPGALQDLNRVPGFYIPDDCQQEIILDTEADVQFTEGPIQTNDGLSFFNCYKTIKIPNGYNLIARCSKFSISNYDENNLCVAFAQINDGQKFCFPERISGIFESKEGNDVKLRLHSNAFKGTQYKIGRPLFDCRFTLKNGHTKKGFITVPSLGIYSSFYRSMRIEDIVTETKRYDIPKMSKDEFQRSMTGRLTTIEGFSACGGHINLDKYGYTFNLIGEQFYSPERDIDFDCRWFFHLSESHLRSSQGIVVKCDKMPIFKPAHEKCSAAFEVDNEYIYCNDDEYPVVDGIFPVRDGILLLRARSNYGNFFSAQKPIFSCTIMAVSLYPIGISSSPKEFYYSKVTRESSSKKETIDVSLDGRNPTYFFGDRMSVDMAKNLDDTWLLRVPPTKTMELDSSLVIECKRLNVVKVPKKCSAYYLVNDRTKVCEGEDLNGIFLSSDDFGNCMVKIQIKSFGTIFMGNNIPHYQCKAFIQDVTPWDQVSAGVRLTSVPTIGGITAGIRKNCTSDKCTCGWIHTDKYAIKDEGTIEEKENSVTESDSEKSEKSNTKKPKTKKTVKTVKIIKEETSNDSSLKDSAPEDKRRRKRSNNRGTKNVDVEKDETSNPGADYSAFPPPEDHVKLKAGQSSSISNDDTTKTPDAETTTLEPKKQKKPKKQEKSKKQKKLEKQEKLENQEKSEKASEKSEKQNDNTEDSSEGTKEVKSEIQASILGSFMQFDDMPLSKLSQVKLGDFLIKRYKIKEVSQMKIGQLAALAEIGQLGKLGGATIGQIRNLKMFNSLSYSHFGQFGGLQVKNLEDLSKNDKLGLFENITFNQLIRLAKTQLLHRLTIGLTANIIPVDSKLRSQISGVISRVNNDTSIGKNDNQHYVFQLPHVSQVYDLLTLSKILQKTLKELKKQSKESDSNEIDINHLDFNSERIQQTKNDLEKNVNNKFSQILDLINSDTESKRCRELLDCTESDMTNIVNILLRLGSQILEVITKVQKGTGKLLNNLHHIQLWVMNRLLVGALGGTRRILVSPLEPILDSVCKVLGGFASDLKKETMDVSFSNDRVLYLIVKILGSPYEKQCHTGERPTKVRTKRFVNRMADNDSDDGTSRSDRNKWSSDEAEQAEIAYRKRYSFDDTDPDDGMRRRKRSPKKSEESDQETDRMVKEESSEEIFEEKPCENVKDNLHFKAVVDGKSGGTLSSEKLIDIIELIGNELKKDVKKLIEEIRVMDTARKWRLSRILIGLISGIVKLFEEALGQVNPALYQLATVIINGIDVLLTTSSDSLAMGISGTMDSSLITLGLSLRGILGMIQGKSVNETILPFLTTLMISGNGVNVITEPILNAFVTLINNIANLNIESLIKLLKSLLNHIKDVIYETQKLTKLMSRSQIEMFLPLHASVYSLLSKSGVIPPQEFGLLYAVSDMISASSETTVDSISRSLYILGAPFSNLMHAYNSLSNSKVEIHNYSVSRWEGKKLDNLNEIEVTELFNEINIQILALASNIYQALTNNKLNLSHIVSCIRSLMGFLLTQTVALGNIFENKIDKETVQWIVKLIAEISKFLAAVANDLGFAINPSVVNRNLSPNSNLADINTKVFGYYSSVFNSIGSTGMFAEVGFTTMALAYGVGTTVDGISNLFYDYGRFDKSPVNFIIPGTIGAIENELSQLTPNRIDNGEGIGQKEGETSADLLAAKKRRQKLKSRVRHSGDKKLSKKGLMVVATDDGNGNFAKFYDDDDLDSDVKDVIMEQISNILLQKKVHDHMILAQKGDKIEPLSIEVEIPFHGETKKVNVTLSSFQYNDHNDNNDHNDHNDNNKNDESNYTGPNDNDSTGFDLSGEYVPPSLRSSCLEWRSHASKKLQSYSSVFIPKCLSDGSFSPLQCDSSVGICWCVTENGHQIEGTVSKLVKPNCERDKLSKTTEMDNEIDIGTKYQRPKLLYEKSSAETHGNLKHVNQYKSGECLRVQRQREILKQMKAAYVIGVFIPQCADDGSYAPLQCDKRTSMCWCVRKDGKEIPETAKIGDPPKDCAKQQKIHFLQEKEYQNSWNYLWAIVRKWQETTHIKVVRERRINPDYRYRPIGTLVRLPKSSGFDNSVIFLAKEPAAPGLPSPYDAWINTMSAENAMFNKTQYEIPIRELDKLTLISLPGNLQLPLITIIEVYPAAGDLYKMFHGDVNKLESSLKGMDIDWNELLQNRLKNSREMGNSRGTGNSESNRRHPAVIGDGNLNMVSTKKMCFCYQTPKAGIIYNVASKSSGSGGGGGSLWNSFIKKSPFSSLLSSSNSSEDDVALKAEGSGEASSSHEVSASLGFQSDAEIDSGPAMQSVKDIVHKANPFRLLMEFKLSSALAVTGVNLFKFRAPVDVFSNEFYDRLAAKTEKSKAQLGEEMGADIVGNKGEFNIGALLQFSGKFHLSLGDLIELFGYNLRKMADEFETSLIEAARGPLKVANVFLKQGFTNGMTTVMRTLKVVGGPINGISEILKMLLSLVSVPTYLFAVLMKIPLEIVKLTTNLDVAIKGLINTLGATIGLLVGPSSPVMILASGVTRTLNSVIKVVQQLLGGQLFQALLEIVGNLLGSSGKAVVALTLGPIFSMLGMVFTPLMMIPRILFFTNVDIFSRILAIPPVLIHITGGLIKPVLMVVEPFIRCLRFLYTGEYRLSMSAGLEVSASYGFSIWGGAYEKNNGDKRLQLSTSEFEFIHENYTNVENLDKNGKPKPAKGEKKKSKGADEDQTLKRGGKKKSKKKPKKSKKKKRPKRQVGDYNQDKITASKYQGGPPPDGYKLGVKSSSDVDLQGGSVISRILLIPDFLLKVGGNLFVPFASVLAPAFRATNEVLFGQGDLLLRIMNVPPMFTDVPFIGPIADIINAFMPVLKLARTVLRGELGPIEIIMQGPSLVKQMSGGILTALWNAPGKVLRSMTSFFEGPGGVLSMLKMQAAGDVPLSDPGSAKEFEDAMGGGFGGIVSGYIEAFGPVASFASGMFDGIIGNIIDAEKFNSLNLDLSITPLKSILVAFGDLKTLIQVSTDPYMILSVILGGQDPDALERAGISANKMAEAGIDFAYLLAGGAKFLPKDKQKMIIEADDTQLAGIGIDVTKLKKIGLTKEKLIESGILDADGDSLINIGIDPFNIINRILRNSVEDKRKLSRAGIDFSNMLRAGVDPAWVMAAGIMSINAEILNKLGIQKGKMTPEQFGKIGVDVEKLNTKGLDAEKLIFEGVQAYDKRVIKLNLGINVDRLINSMQYGLERERMLKAGIDLKTMLRSGTPPNLILIGGLRNYIRGDLNKENLLRIGIDGDKIIAMGINVKMLVDVGAAGLNPTNMVKLGIDPMRTMIGVLSAYGLEGMTGGIDDKSSTSVGFVSSLIGILGKMTKVLIIFRWIPLIGPLIVEANGELAPLPAFFMYEIVGVNGKSGFFGFLKLLVNGKLTLSDTIRLINPFRLIAAYCRALGTTVTRLLGLEGSSSNVSTNTEVEINNNQQAQHPAYQG